MAEEQLAIERINGQGWGFRDWHRGCCSWKGRDSAIYLFFLEGPFTVSETLAISGGCEVDGKDYWI